MRRIAQRLRRVILADNDHVVLVREWLCGLPLITLILLGNKPWQLGFLLCDLLLGHQLVSSRGVIRHLWTLVDARLLAAAVEIIVSVLLPVLF